MKFCRILTWIIFSCFHVILSPLYPQSRGVNHDPNQMKIGEKPYEMVDRVEQREPAATFMDCSQWIVETVNCTAGLYRTQEERLYREYCGNLNFTATNNKAEITLRLVNPIVLHEEWDCIDFWNFGFHWLWGEPKWQTAMSHYALVQGNDGTVYELDFTQAGYRGMVHKYWHLSHHKLKENIGPDARFIGFRFKGNNTPVDLEQTFYLGPVYVYKEKLNDLSFQPWPEKLPFPLRKETILPLNKSKDYENSVIKSDKHFEFVYKDNDQELRYVLDLEKDLLSGLTLIYNDNEIPLNRNAKIYFKDVDSTEWIIHKSRLKSDTLFVNAKAQFTDRTVPFDFWYTIRQKSMIIGICEKAETGSVTKITLGETWAGEDAKLVTIPFLSYGGNRIPQILYSNGLFFFKQFDWYVSDASDFIPGANQIEDGWANYNKGVRYIPKTNGILNSVREKLFINVSDDVQEILPTIDNPKSPMRSVMANRLWEVEGSPDHNYLRHCAREQRALGLSNVAVRYHEGIWRDGGESYTFRTQTAPGRGGDSAVVDLVHNIKKNGWLVGLYTNYTDYAPVNKNWNPDWVKRGPHGEWEISWSRCYSPKPMIAWEQEQNYAPKIHEKFGSNHSYCDVHTAVSPVSRVDYDYRVPGAATFRRTLECYGLLLLNEKKSYHGPVYSEGNYHWWYAGLTDGNYGNAYPRLTETDIFPDFQLLKIHPLEMDAGNVNAIGSEYLAYTLAYGHIGLLNGDLSEKIKRYAMLQPLQEYYSMIPVKSICYFDEGVFYNSSEAIQRDLIRAPKLYLEYESGLKVYINFSDDNWKINVQSGKYILPQYGFFVSTDNQSITAYSGIKEGLDNTKPIEYSEGKDQFYFDTHDQQIQTNDFICNGQVYLKKETFGWEIIPARDFQSFAFNPKRLGLDTDGVMIEGVNIDDLPVEQVQYSRLGKMILFSHDNKNIFKYRICPD